MIECGPFSYVPGETEVVQECLSVASAYHGAQYCWLYFWEQVNSSQEEAIYDFSCLCDGWY